MSPGPDDRDYSARDLQAVSGLSSRQQNDWDNRGMLPHGREGDEGWRRYSPREMFVLMACAEIRRRYGTPVERLRWVQSVMLEDEANHFEAAIRLIDFLGVGVWLCTDLEETFILDSELEFVDLWQLGHFGATRESAFVFVPVNGIVNKLLACLKEPIELPAHGRGYEIMRHIEGLGRVRSAEEEMVLNLIRRDDVETVEVVSPKGHVETIRSTSRVNTNAQLKELQSLLEEPYQRLTIYKRDGKTVHIEQEVTIRADKAVR